MSENGSFDRTFYVEEQEVRLTPFVMHSGWEILWSARRHLDVVCLAYSQKLATVTRIFFPHPIPHEPHQVIPSTPNDPYPYHVKHSIQYPKEGNFNFAQKSRKKRKDAYATFLFFILEEAVCGSAA